MSKTQRSPAPIEFRTRQSLLDGGHTVSEIRRRVQRKELNRIHRGTFVRSADIDDLFADERYRVRVAAVGTKFPRLVVSHESALALYGLPLYRVDFKRVHFTNNSSTGANRSAERQLHSGLLTKSEVTTVAGVRITTVARTLIDFARSGSFESVVIALDAALQRRMVTAEELVAAMADARERRGAPAARRALLAADGRSESPGETLTRIILSTLRLPKPEAQIRIFGTRGSQLGRVDLGFPELAVLIEFDGREKYQKYLKPGQTAAEAIEAERQRENSIRELGYLVIRIVWRELDNPAQIRARVLAAVALARRRLELGGCSGSFELTQAVG